MCYNVVLISHFLLVGGFFFKKLFAKRKLPHKYVMYSKGIDQIICCQSEMETLSMLVPKKVIERNSFKVFPNVLLVNGKLFNSTYI